MYHFFLLSTAFAIPVRSRVAEQKEKEKRKKKLDARVVFSIKGTAERSVKNSRSVNFEK